METQPTTRNGNTSDPHRRKGRELTPKMRRFATVFLSNGEDAAKAYREVYSNTCAPNTAYNEGRRLLRHPLIAPLIAEARARGAKRIDAVMDRYAVTVENVRRRLAMIAFSDIADFGTFEKDGTFRFDVSQVNASQSPAIQEITVEEFMDGRGEGARPVRRTKFKLRDSRAALVDLGKHLGMFGEEPGSGSGGDTVAAQQLRAELRDMFAKAIEANQGMRALMQQAVAAPLPAAPPAEFTALSGRAETPPVIDVEPAAGPVLPGNSSQATPAPARKTLADLKL